MMSSLQEVVCIVCVGKCVRWLFPKLLVSLLPNMLLLVDRQKHVRIAGHQHGTCVCLIVTCVCTCVDTSPGCVCWCSASAYS